MPPREEDYPYDAEEEEDDYEEDDYEEDDDEDEIDAGATLESREAKEFWGSRLDRSLARDRSIARPSEIVQTDPMLLPTARASPPLRAARGSALRIEARGRGRGGSASVSLSRAALLSLLLFACRGDRRRTTTRRPPWPRAPA
jgi:hypothetical protein